MTSTETQLSLILDEVEVVAVERLSPSFVRVELGGPALADFGVDGPLYDLRIKLVFPNDAGRLPSFAGADESWWDTWLELPEAERGHMRTYTVRAVRGSGAGHPDGRRPGAAPGRGRGRARLRVGRAGDRRGPAGHHGAASRCRVRRHRVRARGPRASCCWWPTRRPCLRSAASWRTSTTTPAASRCSRCRCRRTRPPSPSRSRRRGGRGLAAPRRGAARVAARPEVRRRLGVADPVVRWWTRRWTPTCGRPRILLRRDIDATPRSSSVGRLAAGANNSAGTPGKSTYPWPPWATTSTGSMPGSPGSRRWSRGCVGCW